MAITIVDIPAGAAANSNTPVYKAGCFNIRALNWPASYDLDSERFSAFAAAAGTQTIKCAHRRPGRAARASQCLVARNSRAAIVRAAR